MGDFKKEKRNTVKESKTHATDFEEQQREKHSEVHNLVKYLIKVIGTKSLIKEGKESTSDRSMNAISIKIRRKVEIFM